MGRQGNDLQVATAWRKCDVRFMTSELDQSGHAERVRDQFSRQAGEYAVSAPHSSGESLDILQRLAAKTRHRWAVDVATGAGFTAFAVAPYADRVLATDIAPGMIRVTRDAAAERGLNNVSAVFSAAENLPFRSGAIDLVTCRTAPHHFHRLDDAMHEIARVIRPGGAFLLVDTCTSEDPEVAAWQQVMEVRRDPTHVRNLPPSEWRSLIESAGLTVDFETFARVEMTFDGWTQRSGTPADVREELRIEWRTAPPRSGQRVSHHSHRRRKLPLFVARVRMPGHEVHPTGPRLGVDRRQRVIVLPPWRPPEPRPPPGSTPSSRSPTGPSY